MKTATIILTAALGLAVGPYLHAQPSQRPAPGQIGLSFSSSFTVSGDSELKERDAKYKDVAITSQSWGVAQRIPLGQHRHLTLGLEYDQTDIDADSGTIPLPDRLQSLGASFKYGQPINQQWIMSASIGAASQVAGTGLLSDGWGARASVVAIYNRSKELTFMFGAAYASLAEDLKLLPVLGCDWRPTEKWSFALGFPRTGATYKINQRLAVGIGASGGGGSFFVKNDPQPGVAPRSLADSRLQYLEIRLGVNCDWKINPAFRVTGTVGQVLYRRFKYIDRDYQLKSNGTVPFVSLAATLSL